MDATAEKETRRESDGDDGSQSINVSKRERQISTALGAAVLALSLGRNSKVQSLILLGLGSAFAYRGLTGRCGLYRILKISTLPRDEATDEAGPERVTESDDFNYGVKNQFDKDRFDKLKNTQVERGRDEDRAIEIAAQEVKELRRREGRSKEEQSAFLEELDASWTDK